MKIECINSNEYIVYLNKYYYSFNKETIDKCLNKIFRKLKKEYNVDIYSTFNIKCYINDYYGLILNIRKDNDPFLKYREKTNTNIVFYYNTLVLYEISDYFIKDKLECKIYKYNNKYYIELKEDYFNICEHINKIIFGDKVLKIVNSIN